MNIFDDYDKKFPNLIMDILHYFDLCRSTNGKSINDRTVLNFSRQYLKPNGKFTVNPQILVRICDKLCQKHLIERIKISDALGFNNLIFLIVVVFPIGMNQKNRWNFSITQLCMGWSISIVIIKT